ncbi:CAP domain-containing protein, partial [Kitasatospora sp. NPDC047058]|uniref:CAP domain-containing protein n=1 Tax=Kitasatospora sp. NPDC047058 TaxID=3155620 RepID=UPI0033C38CF0
RDRTRAPVTSEPRTPNHPAAGGRAAEAARAARRPADGGRGRGRRSRRGGAGPVVAVVAAVAGTGVIAALTGAGYAMYGKAETDREAVAAVAMDPQIAAEAGNHDGIQIPGAGDPAAVPAPDPSATDVAQAAPATPAPTTAAPTTAATTPAASPSSAAASAKPSSAATSSAKASTSTAPAARTGAPAPATAASGTAAQYAQQVVDLVNAERGKAGCGPLTADSKLAAAAQGHSEDMANRNYFDHASPEGYHADHRIEAVGYRWSSWGENIARGQKDPAAVMDAWMNSPGHRANILNCSFKQIGVGVRTGSGGPWWTQVFAVPA